MSCPSSTSLENPFRTPTMGQPPREWNLQRPSGYRLFMTPLRPTAVLLALVFGMLTACAARSFRSDQQRRGREVQSSVESFRSDGEAIRVDVYRPKTRGRHPSAIVLHGSGGIHAIAPSAANRYAYALAEMGVETFVVHYFDGTGHFSTNDEAEREYYFRWVREVKDAVTWVRARTDVTSNRISLVGQSLGSWVAVGAGAQDPRIYRMALFGAGLEPFLADSIRRMPATLLFHGGRDSVVPLADAQHLVNFLVARRYRVQLVVYAGEEHAFGDSAATDALVRTASFLTAPRRRRVPIPHF